MQAKTAHVFPLITSSSLATTMEIEIVPDFAKILIQKVATMALIRFDGAGPGPKHRSYLESPCHRERSSDLGRPVPQPSPFQQIKACP